MKRGKGSWIVLASVLSILAVLDSGCGVLDTILRGVAGSCARTEVVVTRPDDPRGGLCNAANCSLRQAISLSNACPGVQTIRIPAGTYTLAIPGRDEDANVTGDLDILQSLTLIGDGRPGIIANEIDRVVEIHSGATVTLQNLGIAYGSAAGAPGDGLANHGNLTASDILFYGNSGIRGAGGGGGLWNWGTASISHSAFIQNYGELDAAGVNNEGSLTLDNVTLTDNRGYAIENRSGGSVEIVLSTIANNNFGGDEAAYEIWNAGPAGSFGISNSIVAGHVAEGNCLGPIRSNGFNLDSSSAGGASTCGLNQPSDLNGVDPVFERFSFLLHPTLPLGDGSPALDSADPARCGGTDQRGVPRPQGPACDRGAYEKAWTPPRPTAIASPTLTPSSQVVVTVAPPTVPGLGPRFQFTINGNCRQGPSTAYPVVTSFFAGDQVTIEGRNEDSSWYWVIIPNSNSHCAVSASTGSPQGPLGGLPLIPAPALPATTVAPPPATTVAPPPSPPPAPGKFSVSTKSCTSSDYIVTLQWGNVNGELGYRVYRDGKLLATLPANSTSYEEASPDNNPHGYRVEAFNDAGASSSPVQTSAGCLY